MFKNEDIKTISKASDIVEVIMEYSQLHKKRELFYTSCPFCKEKSQSFIVYPKKQQFHCFSCGRGGNVFSFVMQSLNCSFEKAVEVLAVRAALPVPTKADESTIQEKMRRMYQINDLACAFFYQRGRSDERLMKYLKKERKLSDATVKAFQLGLSGPYGCELYKYLRSKGCSNEELLESGLIGYQAEQREYYDKFWDRVMFPIFNEQRKIVGFGGRAFGDKKPKYINSVETIIFDKSHELYGLGAAKTKGKAFILCEGYVDVISMHQAGFTSAVASLGTSLTYSQAKIIREYTNKVYIAYDSDEPGIKAASRAVQILESVGLKVAVISTSPYKDVDELLKSDDKDYSEMKARLDNAIDGKTFLIKQLKENNAENLYEEIVNIIV